MRQIPNNIENVVASPESEKSSETMINSLDAQLSERKMRHRIVIVKLDHWLEYLTHPLIVALCIIVLFVLFFVLRFCAVEYQNDACKICADSLFSILMFGAGAVFAYLVTVFFDHQKRKR